MSLPRWYRRRSAPHLVPMLVLAALVSACGQGTPTTPLKAPPASSDRAAGAGVSLWVSPTGSDTGTCTMAPCKTINYAVDQASPGEVISVASGTYMDSVMVMKKLTLLGHGATIDAAGKMRGVVITGAAAAGTRLSGFTVDSAYLEGIFVLQTSNVTIDHNTVTQNDQAGPNSPPCANQPDDCGEAIHLQSVTHSTVRDNVVRNNVGGILLTDENGPAAYNMIRDNQVLDNPVDCGITLASHWFDPKMAATPNVAGVYRNSVLHNTSMDNGAAGIGIFAGPPGAAAWGNVVSGNTATDNGQGGVLIHSHAPSQYVNDNVITNNMLSGNGRDPVNTVVDATEAISMFSAVIPITRTVISDNRISDEHYGIITLHAMKLSGLPSNKFAASVQVPISLH